MMKRIFQQRQTDAHFWGAERVTAEGKLFRLGLGGK
jgi:hypothetical protein